MSRLGAVLAMLGALCACRPPGDLHPEEERRLHELALGEPPPSTSDPVIEDPRAVELGHRIFFDPAFSGPLAWDSPLGTAGETGRVSCNTCHDVAVAGADPRPLGPVSLGVKGWTRRNTPAVFNAAWRAQYRWGGEYQTLLELMEFPLEGGAHDLDRLGHVRVLADRYAGRYEALFGALPAFLDDLPPDQVSADLPADQRGEIDAAFENLRRCLEAYVRQLRTERSPFDRYLAGELDALSPEALAGARLFVNRAACNDCHRGPTLSDQDFHVIGVAQPTPWDLGFEETGAFATPPLRDVELTAPYMHDGSLRDLWEVVEFYQEGGAGAGFPGERDRRMRPLDLSPEEVESLVAFLESLTGERGPAWALRPPEGP